MRSLLSADRCDEIKKEILFMYEECEIDTYPIDCFAIAQKLYYVLRPYSTLSPEQYTEAWEIDSDGFSRVELNPITRMNQYVIYYNDKINQGRMRWTIFHEIGHIYLGHHDNLDDTQSTIEEAEANFFAKYAIAPPPLINITECKSARDIAITFCVSLQASLHLYSYYQKWLHFGPQEYEPFELAMLELFHAA